MTLGLMITSLLQLNPTPKKRGRYTRDNSKSRIVSETLLTELKCQECGELKPLKDFPVSKKKGKYCKPAYDSYCYVCKRKIQNEMKALKKKHKGII